MLKCLVFKLWTEENDLYYPIRVSKPWYKLSATFEALCYKPQKILFKFFLRNLRRARIFNKAKSYQQALLAPDLAIVWSHAFLSRGNLYLIIIIWRASFLRPLHSTRRRECQQKLLRSCRGVQNEIAVDLRWYELRRLLKRDFQIAGFQQWKCECVRFCKWLSELSAGQSDSCN